MGEWVVVIMMACVTLNGESKNQEIGLAINKQSELMVVVPSVLDIHLKRKEQMEDYVLFSDDQGKLYSLLTIYEKNKFIFFITEVEEKVPSPKERWIAKPNSYQAVQSFIISSMDPIASRDQEEFVNVFQENSN